MKILRIWEVLRRLSIRLFWTMSVWVISFLITNLFIWIIVLWYFVKFCFKLFLGIQLIRNIEIWLMIQMIKNSIIWKVKKGEKLILDYLASIIFLQRSNVKFLDISPMLTFETISKNLNFGPMRLFKQLKHFRACKLFIKRPIIGRRIVKLLFDLTYHWWFLT